MKFKCLCRFYILYLVDVCYGNTHTVAVLYKIYLMCHNFQSGVFFLLPVVSFVIKYLSILYLTPRLIILSKSTLNKYYSKKRIANNTFSRGGADINF